MISPFLDALGSVSGPLTLIAFLAVVVLAVIGQLAKGGKGLEGLYALVDKKVTRERFYDLTALTVRRLSTVCVVVFLGGFLTFVLDRLVSRDGPIAVSNDGFYNDGTYIEAPGGQVVNTGDVQGDLNIGQRAPIGTPADNLVVHHGKDWPGEEEGGDSIFMVGEGNRAVTEGGNNTVVTQGTGNTVVAQQGPGNQIIASAETVRTVYRPNPDFIDDVRQHMSGGLTVASALPEEGMSGLRASLGLTRYGSDNPRATDECTVKTCPEGVYGYTMSWVIGQDPMGRLPLVSSQFGAADFELQKRSDGVLAVAGFISADQASALANPPAEDGIALTLYNKAYGEARVPVSVPIARIEGIATNGAAQFDMMMKVKAGEEDFMSIPAIMEVKVR